MNIKEYLSTIADIIVFGDVTAEKAIRTFPFNMVNHFSQADFDRLLINRFGSTTKTPSRIMSDFNGLPIRI